MQEEQPRTANDQPLAATMKLDPNRPMLEQLEEMVLLEDSDQASEWLKKTIYQNPEIMSMLSPTTLDVTTTDDAEQASS